MLGQSRQTRSWLKATSDAHVYESTPGNNEELAESKILIINGLGLELMRRIETAFKPHGILNSGKVL